MPDNRAVSAHTMTHGAINSDAAAIPQYDDVQRALHGAVAQELALALDRLDRVEADARSALAHSCETMIEGLTDARDRAEQALQEVRNLSRRLRASDRGRLGRRGDPLANGDPGVQYLRTQLYFIAREAVSNAMAHSQAAQITTRITRSSGLIALMIEDDGSGFIQHNISPGRMLGLRSMQERAATLGGHCRIASRFGHGTFVHIEIPVKAPR